MNVDRIVMGVCVASMFIVVGSNMMTIDRIEHKIEESNKEITNLKQEVQNLSAVVYNTQQKVAISQKELDCLAKNIYHEAGIESYEGKMAVAQVTHNRLKSGKWGDTWCKVVYAKAQFSWTLYKKYRTMQPKGKQWDASVKAAKDFIQGKRVKTIETSMFYHADYIRKPKWAKTMAMANKIGVHIFYA